MLVDDKYIQNLSFPNLISIKDLQNYQIPTIDYEIIDSNLLLGVANILNLLFPQWNINDCKLIKCTAGLTNKLVKATHIPSNHSVLIRIYGKGTNSIIDRDRELLNLITLSSLGLCPGLYGRFTNGMVYGYVDGLVFSQTDLVDSHKSKLVAQHTAVWHKIDIPAHSSAELFKTLRAWMDLVPNEYTDPAKNEQLEKSGYSMAQLRQELVVLETYLKSLNSPVVFCHNDIQQGNIIYNPTGDSVSFIDYEYGSVSYRGFDLGNHFCEFAGFDCNWSNYPSVEFQKQWLSAYLEALNDGVIPDAQTVDQICIEVQGFSLASHFFWSVWALIQAEISDLDYNYLEYANGRLNEYFKRKPEWMRL